MQLNGKFSCDWSYHSGKYYETMKYPIVNPTLKDRNHEDMLKDIKSAIKEKSINNNINHVKGLKSASPLINLRHFDLAPGFVPDYMHFLVLVLLNNLQNIL